MGRRHCRYKISEVGEFYYPKGHKFLGRDQYIEKQMGSLPKDTQWMNNKDIDRMFKRMRIKDVDKIPKNLEFDISDPNFVKRMENLQRLEGVDKEIYFRTKVLNDPNDWVDVEQTNRLYHSKDILFIVIVWQKTFISTLEFHLKYKVRWFWFGKPKGIGS